MSYHEHRKREESNVSNIKNYFLVFF